MYNRSELSKAIKQAKTPKSQKKTKDIHVDIKGDGYKNPKNSNKPALKLYTDSIYNPTDKDLMLYPDNGMAPVFKSKGDMSTTFFPGANSVVEVVSKQSGGNTDPGNNALELHMFYDKDVFQDGGEYLELTDEEIKQYRDGGYIVEELPQAQKGITISDPKEYAFRKQMYDDSLAIYNSAVNSEKWVKNQPFINKKDKVISGKNWGEHVRSLPAYSSAAFDRLKKTNKKSPEAPKYSRFNVSTILNAEDVPSGFTGSWVPLYKKPVQPVELKEYKPNLDTDLSAWLKTQKAPTSYADRKKLYEQATGKTDYKGTAEQNIGLLKLLKQEGLDYKMNNQEFPKSIELPQESQSIELPTKPVNPIKSDTIKAPSMRLEWFQTPTGTWYQDYIPDQVDYNINTGSYKKLGGLTQAQDGGMFKPGQIYTYNQRPGSYYKLGDNNQILIKNKSTNNQYIPIVDPDGTRRKTLEQGFQSGNTQKYVKPQTYASSTNDFFYSKAEAMSEKVEENAMQCLRDSKNKCLGSAFSYYDKYVAPKLGSATSWQMKEAAGMSSGKEGNPTYDLAGESWDSWDIAARFAEKEGKVFYKADNNLGTLKDLAGKPKKEIENYWRQMNMPIGTIINAGSAGADGTYGESKSYNKEKGFIPSNHSAVVVGYDETGLPYVYDYGHIRPITDPTNYINYMGVTNVVAPKETLNYTYDYLKKEGKLKDEIKPLNIKVPGMGLIADKDELQPFIDQLVRNKASYMNRLGLTNDQYDEYAKRAVATALAETRGGDDSVIRWKGPIPVPSYLTDKLGFGETEGITQINTKLLFDNKDMSNQLKSLGITKDNYDPYNPYHHSAASLAYIKDADRVAQSNLKKNPNNKQDLDPAAAFYYQWNTPSTLVKGEAQGDNANVKRFMQYYNMIQNKKLGGVAESIRDMSNAPLPVPPPDVIKDSLAIQKAFKEAEPLKRLYLTTDKKNGKANVNLVNNYVNKILRNPELQEARNRLSRINNEDPLSNYVKNIDTYDPRNPNWKVYGTHTYKPFVVPSYESPVISNRTKSVEPVIFKSEPEIGKLPVKTFSQVKQEAEEKIKPADVIQPIRTSEASITSQKPETFRTASRSQTVMEPDPNRPAKFRVKELRQVPYSAYFPGEGWEDMNAPRVMYYNPTTEEETTERFQQGGLTKAQDGGQYYTYSDSKGIYRKVGDKWEVDWNRSGNFQPLSKGNVKQREAALNKGAKQFFDQDYSALVDNRNQAFESAPAKPVAKKLTPEQRVAQKQFDQSFQVTDKSNYEQIENEAKKVIDQSKAFAKEKGLEFTKADEDRVVRDMFAYSGVYDPIRGSIERPVIDMPSDSSVSFEAPQNPTFGDYAGRTWDMIRNPIDAFNYSVRTGDVSNMPWNYSAYEDAKSSTGYRDFTDDNIVGSALNVASYLHPAGAIMHGVADMMELPGRAYKNIQEGNWGDLATDIGITALEFVPGIGLIDDLAQGARRLELNRLRNIPIPNRQPRIPGYITTDEQYQQYADYLASSANQLAPPPSELIIPTTGTAGRTAQSRLTPAPSTVPTVSNQQRQNAELLSEWINNRGMSAEQLQNFIQRDPDWARLVNDYSAVTGNAQQINAFLSGTGPAPSSYTMPNPFSQVDPVRQMLGSIDLTRPQRTGRDTIRTSPVTTWDSNTFISRPPSRATKKKGPLEKIQNVLTDLDKNIGSFLEKKFGDLKESISIVDIENEVNALLEKGVGVKKGDFKIKIAAGPGGANADIHLDIKDYLTQNKELLEKSYPGADIDAWLDTVPDGYVNSGTISIPSTLSSNAQSRTFTEMLRGKPRETAYLHSGISSPIDRPGLRKKGEFPFQNWDVTVKNNILNNLGVSGEYNKAINEVLKSMGYGLYSGGTGHLSDGAKRYVREFLNNRVDIVNPDAAKTFLESLNDTETMRLINEALQDKNKPLPSDVMNTIQNIIFKYKKKGGYVNNQITHFQEGGTVEYLTQDEIDKLRAGGAIVIEE